MKIRKTKIDTIFFDVGGTLRHMEPDEKLSEAAGNELAGLLTELGAGQSVEEIFACLETRWKENRRMARHERLDVSEIELWTKYLLPECPAEAVALNASRLTSLWRTRKGRRTTDPEAKETLTRLQERGYKLGIVSNTVTENEIPEWLRAEGLADCFQTVLLSAKVRLRKPDASIYSLAARCIHSKAENCAFVGDKLLEDVAAPKESGFGMTVLYAANGRGRDIKSKGKTSPDYCVERLSELLEIFEPLKMKS